MKNREIKLHALNPAAVELFKKAMIEETERWIASESSNKNEPLLDEIGQWDHTRINYLGDAWNKPKLNNGNKKH